MVNKFAIFAIWILRSVAQMVERHVWDVEVPGSSPGTPTSSEFDIICRASMVSGRISMA